MSSPDRITPSTGETLPVEEQLRRAYQELAFHVENTPLAVIAWEAGSRVVRWNGQAERVFGWTAAEVIGKTFDGWAFVYEEDLPRVTEVVREMIARRCTQTVVTNRNYTKSGSVIWCEWHNSVQLDEAGRVVSVLSLVLDVSERRARAEALAESESRLRAALGGAGMLGWEWDIAARRGYFSSDFATFFGLPADRDYHGPNDVRLAIHPDDYPAVAAAWRSALERGTELRYEHRGPIIPDGEVRWFSTRGRIIRDAEGVPTRVTAVTTDVTERKRAEREREALDRQLLDAQKWESLGVLAGGVAHDFNNILTVVLGNAALARRAVPDSSPAAGSLDQIEQAARRAADLCRQMLTYAGRGPASTNRTDLNRLIRDAAQLLEVPAARHARIRYDLAVDLPPVTGDTAQVRQVLVNLVMNAAEALAGSSGEVLVQTRPVRLTDPVPTDYRLAPPPGDYVQLIVTDTGPGMADAVKARMFDPFFTTKFPGRGLGLAAVLGIVRGHGGGVGVDSEPGRGTTVQVLWPTVGPLATPLPPPAQRPTPKPIAVPPQPPRLTGSALIIDDEMYVREVAASTLEELGYEPLLAGDGPAGVELFRQHSERVRVAVVDVMMPGMTGDQVLVALRNLIPDLPAVFISGYTDRRVGAIGPRTVFVQKPFHPEELAAAVRRVTAGPTNGEPVNVPPRS